MAQVNDRADFPRGEQLQTVLRGRALVGGLTLDMTVQNFVSPLGDCSFFPAALGRRPRDSLLPRGGVVVEGLAQPSEIQRSAPLCTHL